MRASFGMDLMGGRVRMVRERHLKNGSSLRAENGKKVSSATTLMGIRIHTWRRS